MKEKVEQLKFTAIVGVLIQVAILAVYVFFNRVTQTMFIVMFFLIFEAALLFYIILVYERELKRNIADVSNILGQESKDAFIIGGLGLVVYDSSYNIIWMSDYFEHLDVNRVNDKVTAWIPDTVSLFNGDVDVVNVEYEDYVFRVTRNSEARLLYFKDITTEYNITKKYSEEAPVMALVHLDNYQEYTQYEEEQRVYFIDSIVKQNLINWANDLGIFIKRLRNDRYLMLMNEEIFAEILKSNFSIVHKIRNEGQNNDLVLSLSMGIAKGTSDYAQLEEMTNDLLELAQSRGGDQVAVRTAGEEVHYYGGHSESRERRSKARVRVISQTIKELIKNSDKVIIIGHKNCDFDCMGSALGMSRIVTSYKKDVSIVAKSGGIEEKLTQSLLDNQEELGERHRFISEDEALEMLTYETLVLMVDHHSDTISNSPRVIERANRICVIDHHRRKTDFTFQPILSYIESAASSTGELVVELFPYQEKRINLSPLEATIMYTGIIVDTNGFVNRTGSRTFESASQLQRYGADLRVANQYLNDSYKEFELRNKVLSSSYIADEFGIMFAPVYDETIIPRALISQAADELLSIQEAKAVFVISNIDEKRVGISARSKGLINVQKIMEEMGGGGHFNAAALQRDGVKIKDLVSELNDVVSNYLEEVISDESDIIEWC